jgi:hypothetical protein
MTATEKPRKAGANLSGASKIELSNLTLPRSELQELKRRAVEWVRP